MLLDEFYLLSSEFRSWQNAISSINFIAPRKKVQEEHHRGLGSSFGLPHHDYSAATSLHTNDNEDDKDGSSVLTVWIPLNDIANNNTPAIPKTTTAETTARTMKITILHVH